MTDEDQARRVADAASSVDFPATSLAGPNEDPQLVRALPSLHLPCRAWVAASLTPIKDMEVLVAVPEPQAHHPLTRRGGLCCPAFARGLHAALRAIIDGFGINSFNVGILSAPWGVSWGSEGRAGDGQQQEQKSMLLARVVSRGHMSKPASDFGCLEVSMVSSGKDSITQEHF